MSIMLPTYCQDVSRFHGSVRTLRALRALTRLQKKTSNMYIYIYNFLRAWRRRVVEICLHQQKKEKKKNQMAYVPRYLFRRPLLLLLLPPPLMMTMSMCRRHCFLFFFFFFSCALSPLDGLCWLDQDLASPDPMFTNEAKPYCRRMCGGP